MQDTSQETAWPGLLGWAGSLKEVLNEIDPHSSLLAVMQIYWHRQGRILKGGIQIYSIIPTILFKICCLSKCMCFFWERLERRRLLAALKLVPCSPVLPHVMRVVIIRLLMRHDGVELERRNSFCTLRCFRLTCSRDQLLTSIYLMS